MKTTTEIIKDRRDALNTVTISLLEYKELEIFKKSALERKSLLIQSGGGYYKFLPIEPNEVENFLIKRIEELEVELAELRNKEYKEIKKEIKKWYQL